MLRDCFIAVTCMTGWQASRFCQRLLVFGWEAIGVVRWSNATMVGPSPLDVGACSCVEQAIVVTSHSALSIPIALFVTTVVCVTPVLTASRAEP